MQRLESFPVGTRLKALRQTRGLSQRELARRAQITNANLSMIEQDKVSPALSTLEKILQAMTLDLADFFASGEAAQPLRRAEEFLTIRRKGATFKVMPPKTDSAAGRYFASAELAPRGLVDGLWLKGSGTVTGILVDGSAELTLNDMVYPLEVGDGFEFLLNRKHSFSNNSEAPAQLVIAIETKPA